MTINILHISDLHFTRKSESFEQNIILNALKDDVRALCDSHLAPDLIVFSGDLVYSADEDNIYDEVYDHFLDPLMHVARCSDSRIVLCPGNHDASRKAIESKKNMLRRLRDSLIRRELINEACKNGEIGEYARDVFASYNEIQEYFLQPGHEFSHHLCRVYNLDTLDFDLIVVNSAWMTAAGLREFASDERKLLIPELVSCPANID